MEHQVYNIVDITWLQTDTITWWSPNKRIDLVFQHATNGNSFCVVRNNRIYLSCGSSAINTSRSSHRILMWIMWSRVMWSLKSFIFIAKIWLLFVYAKTVFVRESLLGGSFVGVFRIHQRLNKIKQIFLFIILRL